MLEIRCNLQKNFETTRYPKTGAFHLQGTSFYNNYALNFRGRIADIATGTQFTPNDNNLWDVTTTWVFLL